MPEASHRCGAIGAVVLTRPSRESWSPDPAPTREKSLDARRIGLVLLRLAPAVLASTMARAGARNRNELMVIGRPIGQDRDRTGDQTGLAPPGESPPHRNRTMTPPRRILMCPPDHFGIEYEINPWMDRRVGAESARSHQQWWALHDALCDLGVVVERIEPVAGLPDLVFTANAGLIYRDTFVSARFRHGVREGETPLFDRRAREQGFRVVTLPGGVHFEGAGDALFCGETLYGGYGFRSAARGLHAIGRLLDVEVLPLELVNPRFYHLDTCFCPLDAGAALYYPGAFDDYGLAVLRARIPRLIEVTAEEAASFSCNAVVVGRTVILNEGAPRLARSLGAAGYAVRPLPLTEFIKAGGSAKCLTLRLDGEEAAAWKWTAGAISPPVRATA
jgi:N-dimethylarginine dimethylaminohydrolase